MTNMKRTVTPQLPRITILFKSPTTIVRTLSKPYLHGQEMDGHLSLQRLEGRKVASAEHSRETAYHLQTSCSVNSNLRILICVSTFP